MQFARLPLVMAIYNLPYFETQSGRETRTPFFIINFVIEIINFMTIDELVHHAKTIRDSDILDVNSFLSEALEFLRTFAGEKTAFYKQLLERTKKIPIDTEWNFNPDKIPRLVKGALDAFIRYAEKGLLNGVTIQRQAEINVVSDILSQAKMLLDTKGIHPASPCVVAGAALEEFLRNWIDEQDLSSGKSKLSIDSYSKILYDKELIGKQDVKDISAWAGLRNYAAHGDWDKVNDKEKIQLMVDGISLFIRKYS